MRGLAAVHAQQLVEVGHVPTSLVALPEQHTGGLVICVFKRLCNSCLLLSLPLVVCCLCIAAVHVYWHVYIRRDPCIKYASLALYVSYITPSCMF